MSSSLKDKNIADLKSHTIKLSIDYQFQRIIPINCCSLQHLTIVLKVNTHSWMLSAIFSKGDNFFEFLCLSFKLSFFGKGVYMYFKRGLL